MSVDSPAAAGHAKREPLGYLTWDKVIKVLKSCVSDILQEDKQEGLDKDIYTLDLHNRGITGLCEGSISRLRRLRSLDLSFNKIVKIAGIDQIAATLRELKLYNNLIEDISPLCLMRGCSSLESKNVSLFVTPSSTQLIHYARAVRAWERPFLLTSFFALQELAQTSGAPLGRQ